MDTFDDTTTPPDGPLPLSSQRQRRGSRLGMLSSVAMVTALAVVAFAVFTQLGQQRGTGGGAGGQLTWTNVLSGYNVSQLISAPGQPGILYACASKWSPVTSIVNVPGGTYTNPSFTVMRSADGGLTWAATLGKAELAGNCQIALNPANSQEIYVESDPRTVPSNGQVGAFLLHSTDGGRTFTRVDPVLLPLPGSAYRNIWSVEDLHMEGNRLFGLAAVSQPENPPSDQPPAAEPRFAFSVESLVMSSDGGRTWMVLDSEFQPAELEVRGYAVDPAHPDTIYMVVGSPVGPVLYQGPHPPVLPAFPPQPANVSGDLYKTTTGGQRWTRVLSSLPYGATVRLGQSTANSSVPLVYIGGTPSPIPLLAPATAGVSTSDTPSSSVSASPTSEWNGFRLQVSADGGLTWHQAPAPPVLQVYFDLWLVGPNGDIYVYQGGYFSSYSNSTTVTGSSGSGPGSGSSSGSTTVIDTPGTLPPVSSGSPGTPTALPGDTSPTPVHSLPPATPMSGNLPVTPTATGSAAGINLAYRYDPATNQWSGVPMPKRQGALLAVTGSSTGQAVLWFLSEDNQQASLYRSLA